MGILLILLLAFVPLLAIGAGLCYYFGFRGLAFILLIGAGLALKGNVAFYFAITTSSNM